ncbi:Hsp20/alpha crystallin family protein [Streptomyces sp. NBC_01214]|uniref:Hsp20/alpha crystallin family protein n=1 Tax=Streptomyces sp. NBC_01214 TaxID=2903777 RepID=UPI00225371F1|nr:Hsp20/alpha crystallin family protein [Streptomyces sp. NBC_01214]MCX4807551.1 Hsp20/alpha crystallin family protein [Streptomyces sp. NBC_01214]
MPGTHPERRRSPFPDFRDWFGTDFPRFPQWRPSFDTHPIAIEVTNKDGQYTLRAELPGMDPDKDIQITVEGDTLTVSAEHTESKEEKDHSEFRYGSFQRTVRLPGPIPSDEVEAAYEDGVLTVRVPMPAAPEESRRSIPVKRTTAEGKGESS